MTHKQRALFVALLIGAALAPVMGCSLYLINGYEKLTAELMDSSNYWKSEAQKWKDYSQRLLDESNYLLPGGKDGIQCDYERCWKIGDGEKRTFCRKSIGGGPVLQDDVLCWFPKGKP